MTTSDTIPGPPPGSPIITLPVAAADVEEDVPAARVRQLLPLEIVAAVHRQTELETEDLDYLPLIKRVTIGEVTWEIEKPPPGNDQLYVVMMFEGSQGDLMDTHVPGDVRAYVMPMTPAVPTQRRWTCYTISRVTGASVASLMNQERFVQAMSDEIQALANVRDDVIEENAIARSAFDEILGIAQKFKMPQIQRLVEKALREMDEGPDDENGTEEMTP